MNAGAPASSGGMGFGQFFADGGSRKYDRQVLSRRMKVYRPDKRRKKKARYL